MNITFLKVHSLDQVHVLMINKKRGEGVSAYHKLVIKTQSKSNLILFITSYLSS